MAIIYSYPLMIDTISGDDLLLMTDVSDSKKTKSVKVSALPSSGAGITLTTTGTSGPATLIGTVLNVPNYNTSGGGDTYTLQAEAKSSNSVPLKLDAATGSDSTVSLTEGANVTLTRNSATEITIAATGGAAGVSSFTNANGTYISAGTANSAATGAVTVGTIDLSAVDGTSDATTRFLSKDNTWDVPSYTAVTTAAGSSGQVQYNDGSNGFAASAGLVYSTAGSLNTLTVGDQGSTPGVVSIKGADTTVGRLRLYCPDNSSPHYFELMGPDHSGAATYSVQVPEANPGGTEKILSVATWNAGTGKADLEWVNLPSSSTYSAGDGLDLIGTTFSTDLKTNGGLVIETTELAVDLGASSITGTLAVGDGGTGATTLTGLLKGNGTGAITGSAGLNDLSDASFAATANGSLYVGQISSQLSGTPVGNVTLGGGAAKVATTAYDNTVIGSDAAVAITEGHNNVVLGSDSAAALLTGNDNVVIGSDVAATLSTGTDNVVIGKGADVSAGTVRSVIIGEGSSGNNESIAIGQGVTVSSNELGIGEINLSTTGYEEQTYYLPIKIKNSSGTMVQYYIKLWT